MGSTKEASQLLTLLHELDSAPLVLEAAEILIHGDPELGQVRGEYKEMMLGMMRSEGTEKRKIKKRKDGEVLYRAIPVKSRNQAWMKNGRLLKIGLV